MTASTAQGGFARRATRWTGFVVILVAAHPRPGLCLPADEGASEQHLCLARTATGINPPEVCPLFSGSDATHTHNRERRESVVESVEQGSSGVWIVHHGSWTRPERLEVSDLAVVKTVTGPECVPSVVVALDAPEDDSVCEVGLYRLQVDDDLGPDGRVLHVFPDDVVLIEWRGRLRYLAAPEAIVPEWHMVWHAQFTLASPRVPGPNHGAPARKR